MKKDGLQCARILPPLLTFCNLGLSRDGQFISLVASRQIIPYRAYSLITVYLEEMLNFIVRDFINAMNELTEGWPNEWITSMRGNNGITRELRASHQLITKRGNHGTPYRLLQQRHRLH